MASRACLPLTKLMACRVRLPLAGGPQLQVGHLGQAAAAAGAGLLHPLASGLPDLCPHLSGASCAALPTADLQVVKHSLPQDEDPTASLHSLLHTKRGILTVVSESVAPCSDDPFCLHRAGNAAGVWAWALAEQAGCSGPCRDS